MSETLKAKLAELDAKIVAEKEATGEVSRETALAWWDVATAIRDMREEAARRALGST